MTDRTDTGGSFRNLTAEALIRWSTVAVVVIVALGAAIVSYRHAYDLVLAHGETGLTAAIVPATVDGMIYASSMVLLLTARRGGRGSWLAYLGLALGIVATIAANVAHGVDHGRVGAVVAAWPAVALVVSYETLMAIVRAGRPADHPGEFEQDATGCQCDTTVAPVARTRMDAALAAIADGMSQRAAADEFKLDRNRLRTAVNEAAEADGTVAELRPADAEESA